MKIVKATKREILLRFVFCGATGSGKTYSALRLATSLGSPICVIDTEQAAWEDAAAALCARLTAEANNSRAYYGQASGPRPEQSMGD